MVPGRYVLPADSVGVQHFIIYTVLAIARTYSQVPNKTHSSMQKILETALTTVIYAPMLRVFFLAARIRAIHCTQGETEAQAARLCCVDAAPAQEAIVLIIPVLTHESEVTTDEHSNPDRSHGGAERS